MSWFRAFLAQRWARQVKPGKKFEELEFLGPLSAVAAGSVCNTGTRQFKRMRKVIKRQGLIVWRLYREVA